MVVTDGGGGASTTPTTTPPGQSATPPWWSQAVGAAGAGVHGFLEGAKETGNERLRPLQKAFNAAVEKVTTNKQVQQTVGETINDLNDRLSTLKSTVPAKVDEGGKVLRKEYKVGGALADGAAGAAAGTVCDAETVGGCSIGLGLAGGFIGGTAGAFAAEPVKDTVFGAHWLGT